MNTEIWKIINEFPTYEVSNFGRVLNMATNKILKQGETKAREGYRFVTLRRGFKDYQTFGVHRLVADAFCDKSEGLDIVDHIDHDRSNNNAENLRWVNASVNAHNKRKKANTTSKYIGVSYDKKPNKYRAVIRIDGKHKHLGYNESEEECARAYDRKALEVFGQFANLNFPLKDYINY
jgi:hypothetical protein